MAARNKRVRRFEPRFGVSVPMLEAEATYVSREREDYQLLSLTDLRQKLGKLGQSYRVADAVLEQAVTSLPEREQLAVRCLIARDLYFILELYCTHLGAASNAATATAPPVVPATVEKPQSPVLPFSEWLFGSPDRKGT